MKVTKIPALPYKYQRPLESVGVYCRVSTKEKSQLNSLEAQRSGIIHQIDDKDGWHVYSIYSEVESGRFENRPEFNRLLEDCRNKNISVVAIKNIKRLGRNTVYVVNAIRELTGLGVKIYIADSDKFLDTTKDTFINELTCAVAEAESRQMGENIAWGMNKGIKDGTSKLFNRPCYGYYKDADGSIGIKPKEAEVVKLVFNMYLEGASVLTIRDELGRRGIKSPSGNASWSKGTIEKMLRNLKYMGMSAVNEAVPTDYPRKKPVKEERNKYILDEAFPVIIEEELFEKVVDEMNRRSYKKK